MYACALHIIHNLLIQGALNYNIFLCIAPFLTKQYYHHVERYRLVIIYVNTMFSFARDMIHTI